MSTNIQAASIPFSQSTVVRPRRKRNASRKLSTAVVKEAVISTVEKESSPQKTANQKAANINGQSNGHLPMMSTTAAAPMWLLRLHSIYRYSSVTAFLFVSATLVIYGWTVYSQERWGQAYRTMQSLQRDERQLTTTNATLTSKMAKEAEEPGAGLVSPTPGGTIFLTPSHSPNSAPATKIPNSEVQTQTFSPMGY
ncbi:hypothetical protein [Anabaena sp. UHCC 0451]|uniref:hypothetical protein n=1 Tax=Anabaena sp. UHCC 0451 TaxID=2055235 RepID=UPI002B211396|nr:hypothetical protein [Anabaena sp. UHCC 0451]MEA5579199.1 hypothetical protein [Anabaena sp. UHCC 0451]